MKAILIATSLLLTAALAEASSGKCAELKKELAEMQQAQSQVMGSLVNNHETFASTLEEYSSVVTETRGSQSKAIAKEMNDSAKAFRTRGVQGKRMAGKLQEATGDLLARVAECLN
jgi:hypothetical protein